MARYIDAELIDLERVSDSICQWQAQEAIDDTPTADVVEVVRCKECKHSVKHQLGYGCGMNYHLATNGNWFCADGERKEDD